MGADGPRSIVKAKGSFSSTGWRYDQVAVVATVGVSAGAGNDVAWQRFLPTGPVALLPLSDTSSSIVWSTTEARASELVSLPPEEFVAALNDALNEEYDPTFWTSPSTANDTPNPDAAVHELGRISGQLASFFGDRIVSIAEAVGMPPKNVRTPPLVVRVDEGSRASFPLSLAHANQYVRPRLALAGDAAHKVHPLAGQGLNLGLGDADKLTQVVSEACDLGMDVGDVHSLMQYERQRQAAVVPIMAATDFFKRIFSTTNPAIAAVRGLGVAATDRIAPLKSNVIRAAMGM